MRAVTHPAKAVKKAYDADLVQNNELFGMHLEEEERWVNAEELGVEMLNNYVDEYGRDPDYEVLVTEMPFQVIVPLPATGKPWFKYTGVLPADKRMDTSAIDQPILKKIYDWDTTVAGPNLENFIPSMLDEQSNFAGTQLLFSGDKTPEELAQLAEDVIAKWREQNPDQLANFQAWSE